MADSNVSISFGADASDFLDGVAKVSAALQSLPSGVGQIGASLERTSASFSAFGAGAASALSQLGEASRQNGVAQQEAAQIGLAAISVEMAAAREAFSAAKAYDDQLARLKILNASERLAASTAALDREYDAEQTLFYRQSQLAGDSVETQRRILAEKLELDARYAQNSQKIMFQAAEQIAAPFDRAIDSVSSSFSSCFAGMMFGGRNLQMAMAHVAQSLTMQFLRMGLNVAADWAKQQIGMVALTQAAEGQKTAAAAFGAQARQGVAAGEAASGFSAVVANAVKSISVDAGAAGAGATAFMAPFMGPAAVAEGAAVKGAVLSMAAFDIGAWQIDQDQVAMIHRNEMVMPAAEAGAFRSMLSNAAQGGPGQGAGGGGDTHVHLNVSAMDSASVKNWLAGNSRQIMKALDGAVRNGDHLGLRRLATG